MSIESGSFLSQIKLNFWNTKGHSPPHAMADYARIIAGSIFWSLPSGSMQFDFPSTFILEFHYTKAANVCQGDGRGAEKTKT
jgi:hypothetical protein